MNVSLRPRTKMGKLVVKRIIQRLGPSPRRHPTEVHTMKLLRRSILVFLPTLATAACGSSILGPHAPDRGNHAPDSGNHAPDSGNIG